MASRLSLATGLLAAPVITLIAHEGIYLASMQSCRSGSSPSAHLVPAVALLLIGAVIRLAWGDWRDKREASPHIVSHGSLHAKPSRSGAHSSPHSEPPRWAAHSSPLSQSVAASQARSPIQPHGHFLAAVGMSIGVFCALVMLGQWLAVIMLGTCTRQL